MAYRIYYKNEFIGISKLTPSQALKAQLEGFLLRKN